MRKLKLEMQISVDGFVAQTNGKTDWLQCNWSDISNWDHGMINYLNVITESVDCILLSRKMAEEGFIGYWEKLTKNSEHSLFEIAQKITKAQKIVFSKTIIESQWHNTSIANGEIVDEVNKLKNQKGRDIIVYGGAAFVSSLIKVGLIDEFHLFVNPTLLGKGMPIFRELENKQKLIFIKSQDFNNGICVLNYKLDFNQTI